MDATIIKFNALTYTVRTAAKHQHLAPFARSHLVRRVIGRIVVGGIFDAAYRNGRPSFHHAEHYAFFPDGLLGKLQ